MADLTEDIDPHGDTLIIVPSPPKYAQVKDKSNDEDDQDAADDNPQGLSGDALAGSSALEREDNPMLELRLKVSMKHLTVASRRARAMFTRNYRESRPSQTDGLCHWKFEPLFEPEAFRIVMKIFHLQTRDLPESVTLDMMAHIAAIVDDLQCHDAVWFVTKAWIKQLNHRLPSEICKDLIRWILIASVFHETELFESATRTAILHSMGPIPTFGCPIHPEITEMIDEKRQRLLEELVDQLHNEVSRLCRGHYCASSGCSSMLLGALIQDMTANNLFSPRPSKPFLDISLSSTLEHVRKFRSATLYMPHEGSHYSHSSDVWELRTSHSYSSWNQYPEPVEYIEHGERIENAEIKSTQHRPKRLEVHGCSLQRLLSPEIRHLEAKIEGLKLHDVGTSLN